MYEYGIDLACYAFIPTTQYIIILILSQGKVMNNFDINEILAAL
jgi:hypothetical protein